MTVRVLSSLMVVALFGGGSVAMAQGVSGGVKAGVGFSTLSADSSQDVDLDKRTGIVAGGFVTWLVGERFAIQLEGLFTQKGAGFDQAGFTGTTKLDYVEVPVLFVSSTAPFRSSGTSLQFFAGPSIAVKVNAKGSTSFDGETMDFDIPDDAIDRFDLSVVAGAGVTFGHFLIEGRYTVGLSDINSDASDPTKVRNRSLAVLAGVRF